MEQLQLNSEVQQQTTSLTQLAKRLERKDDGYYISVYSKPLTSECLVKSLGKIKFAFPDLDKEFFDIFAERVKELGFGDDRLSDAVNKVIDECVYPRPTIAQFISHNKHTKLFTYEEMQDKVVTGGGANIWKYYDKIKIDDIVYWYRKNI